MLRHYPVLPGEDRDSRANSEDSSGQRHAKNARQIAGRSRSDGRKSRDP